MRTTEVPQVTTFSNTWTRGCRPNRPGQVTSFDKNGRRSTSSNTNTTTTDGSSRTGASQDARSAREARRRGGRRRRRAAGHQDFSPCSAPSTSRVRRACFPPRLAAPTRLRLTSSFPGRFIEVVPHEKVASTFGWDEPDPPIPPDLLGIDITLAPQGKGIKTPPSAWSIASAR